MSVILACTPSICIILARFYRHRRRGDSPIMLQDQDLIRDNLGNELSPVDPSTGLSGSTAANKGVWVDRVVSKDQKDSPGVSACSTLHDEYAR